MLELKQYRKQITYIIANTRIPQFRLEFFSNFETNYRRKKPSTDFLVSEDKKLQLQPSIATQKCDQNSAEIFKDIDRGIVQIRDLNSALNVSRKSS